ncbi:hypothetical protein FCM35_KLT13552 [Carex littledalei]|uniref:Uncharacterized protein n=1 Tax=Carex littledalei TaxID=544730 RepID=A0A833QHB5_9POAL|nr:hypothetical protein FCM35_KLT13552 [Carex littledalei]
MQRGGQNRILSFSQNPLSNNDTYGVEQGWCYGLGSSSNGHRLPSRSSHCRSHDKEHRVAQRSLTKVRKEWMKVKEEMGYAKLCGEHLSEVLVETDKKIEAMLAELDQTDKYVQDLIAQNEEQGYC